MLSFYLSLIDTDEGKSKFEILYLKHRKVMMLEARKYLDEKLAEDAVHTAFVKIADNIKKVGDPADIKTRNFAVIITRNTALDMLKKLGRETELSENMAEAEEIRLTDSPLEKLSKTYRDVLILHYQYGYSVPETAKLLGLSRDATYKRIERAKQELAIIMKEEETL